MTALLDQIASFIQWIYDGATSAIDFVVAALDWLVDEITIIQTVSNVVLPPVIQGILLVMISFMVIMLVVKAVFALL